MNTVKLPAPALTQAVDPIRPPSPTLSLALVRLGGAIIVALVAAFAVVINLPWPAGVGTPLPGDIASVGFQASALVLLLIMWRTGAVGDSVAWRSIGAAATAIVIAAMAAQFIPVSGEAVQLAELTWFIAMIGIFVVSVGVVAAGRWRGPARYLPLASQSWPLVVFPVMMLTDNAENPSWFAMITTVVVTQLLVGLTLAIRPQLTGPRAES
ncbi:hypothetical protein [Cryobacterium sp. BB307]|uniref:hypothetical protein n=1 Tax=Cryobacterium sp. BB307 TaxID=2716317 RepID=UPI001447327F|nr:hypothetical protein [Cryobacterium sp. BB307]